MQSVSPFHSPPQLLKGGLHPAWTAGDSVEIFLMLGGAVCAIIGATMDVRSNRIPNGLTYSGLVAALVVRGGWGGWLGLWQGALGALLGGGIFFVFFLIRGMGAGDVKLMAAVCAWVGFRGSLTVLIATAIAGGALALVYIVFYRRIANTMRNLGALLKHHVRSGVHPHPTLNLNAPSTLQLPYGLAIAIGTLYLLATKSNIMGVIYGH